MNRPIYAELNFDLKTVDEKVKKVLEAQQALREAIDELGDSVVDGLKIVIKR